MSSYQALSCSGMLPGMVTDEDREAGLRDGKGMMALLEAPGTGPFCALFASAGRDDPELLLAPAPLNALRFVLERADAASCLPC